MRLPDLVGYQTAVQHPATAFADPELRASTVATGRLGLPRAVAGNFAVTYQLNHGARQWAVRCFHREAADRASRYAAISRSLAQLRGGPLVPIEYVDSGVRVGNAWFPITTMAARSTEPSNSASRHPPLSRNSNAASLSWWPNCDAAESRTATCSTATSWSTPRERCGWWTMTACSYPRCTGVQQVNQVIPITSTRDVP
jgi:hypothetical protein